MPELFDQNNAEMQTAFDMISRTDNSFFLTGRAGTGKTTFLKAVRETVKKNFVVVAPTGIAAINAGGKTIHSFFGLSFGVLCPGDAGTINDEKFSLIRVLDTIIVDEVSMVRCDVMDAMDRTLRRVRQSSAPFGGVQMVFVGDMFQLEPVVKAEDKVILQNIYGAGPYYFYKSEVIRRMKLPKIEFRKIYRQSDPAFISILEDIRKGSMTGADYDAINGRVSTADEECGKLSITLTSTRKKAQEINEGRLADLDTDERIYPAAYTGKMSPKAPGADVAEENLALKVGAQVMFTKNNRHGYWVNGTLGLVKAMSDDTVTVELDGGAEYKVGRESWESVEYVYDLKEKTCNQTVVGAVIQFPLRLAWAITIHKSQSLTFDRVAIDFGERAFCNGQAYVALSRARSLEGLRLLRPMTQSSVMVSGDVVSFSSEVNDEEIIRREMEVGEAIRSYARNGNYDGAADTLYEMSCHAYIAGDKEKAYDIMRRSLSKVADDVCLFAHDPIEVYDDGSYECRVFKAVTLFYSGHTDDARTVLEGLGNQINDDVDALYILSRCLECREKWEETEEVYFRMYDLCTSLLDKGLDSESFRKFRYRLAILNERVYKDPGAILMRGLIAENPSYMPFHWEMRWMLRLHDDIVAKGMAEQDNPLVKMLFDGNTSDKDYIDSLKKEKKAKSEAWKKYRTFLNHLKLEG